ncbi:MAG: sugar O-acetyltransferase [Candidatus Cellulosilyticum pullistercoris]|uniref:Acetyltransferase n=1 Tax=Candidatus Cellulosilyticum pullistercoris TaxID=2838521 RepID=A0A9E2KBF2_9FIRM|nr:sugar O-acetyltransferase [Candidatus Cellulosilyticum pullistercoris]
MTEKERMLSGNLYLASDKELVEEHKKSLRLTRLFNTTTEEEIEYRKQLIGELFEKTGKQYYIEPPFRCDYGCHISIGENFFANYDCIILDVNKVKIGNNVMFGPRVTIYTAGHPIDAGVRNTLLEYGKPVTIGDDVWVGGSTVINPGVTIGSNVVIGSGSVVTKDIPSGVIAAGNPCKVIREITEKDREFWLQQKELYRN